MRVIERRIGADAHEFLRADLDHGDAGIVVEVRNDMVGHNSSPWMATAPDTGNTPQRDRTLRTILTGTVDS
jgi:hypothetical protein